MTSSYDFDGEKYEEAARAQKEWGRRLIDELDFSGGETILDLGCGDGGITSRLAELVPDGRVVGLDNSRGMLARARRKEKRNLSFVRQDIASLDYRDEFDLIFSNATLHWVKDHRAVLRKCRTALHPGGTLRFNFAGAGNCRNLITVLKRVMARPGFRAVFEDFEWPWYMPPVEDYKGLVADLDFESAKVFGENRDRVFSEEEMIAWIKHPCLVPFLEFLPPGRRSEFEQLVIDATLAETRTEKGGHFETFRRINLIAVKNNAP